MLGPFSIAVPPDVFWPRVSGIIAGAIAELDDSERERRIAYCRDHDVHGVNVERMPNGWLVFVWAGEDLVWLDPRAFVKGMGTTAELS